MKLWATHLGQRQKARKRKIKMCENQLVIGDQIVITQKGYYENQQAVIQNIVRNPYVPNIVVQVCVVNSLDILELEPSEIKLAHTWFTG